MKTNKKEKFGKIVCMTAVVWLLSGEWRGQMVLAEEAEHKILTYTGPMVPGDKEPEYPSQEIEYAGKTYRLVSAVLHDAVEKGMQTYAANSVSYQLEGRQEPPETAIMTLTDEQTGEEYHREVKRMDMTEQECTWSDDFSFSITITGYDADVFFLGDLEIPADADLSSYDAEFLTYLGLPEDCYRIDQIAWSGESYEQDGFLCRDAVATGAKLIRTVEVTYGGQVRMPDIKGKQYVSVYEEVISETETAMVKEEIAPTVQEDIISVSQEEESNLFQKITQWIREHLTVATVRLTVLIGFFGCLILLWMKNSKDKKSREH